MSERGTKMTKVIDGVEVDRVPIMISEHTIALLQLYTKTDKIADTWAWDYCGAHETHESAAKQFIEQLEEHWSPAFLMALRREITRTLENHDKEYGTKFAERDVDASKEARKSDLLPVPKGRTG